MFRTKIHPALSEEKIKLKDQLYLTGSCFSDHMGSKLADYKFGVLTNPFGVIYNPYSLFKLLRLALTQKPLSDDGFLFHQGICRHFDLHSDISGSSREVLEEQIHLAMQAAHKQLSGAHWIIITFGTALVYRHKGYQEVVANCHKVPDKEFEQYYMAPEDILNVFDDFHTTLAGVNPGARIMLTISPVRHIKSTLEKNSISKSILRYAAHLIVSRYKGVHYFPSYEIVLDDLRDYRFYTPDMVHINEVAIEYIWHKLSAACFDEETRQFIREWEKIRKALSHKPFRPDSEEHKSFIRQTIRKLLAFKGKIDINEELEILEKQLI